VHVRVVYVVILAAWLPVCRHREVFPMDGTWARGGISGDHSGLYVMQITDEGSRVTGAVCHSSSGYLIFRDVPVTGRYPFVSFDLPSGNRYDGAITSPDLIEPVLGSASTPYWKFTRSPAFVYDDCRNSHPPSFAGASEQTSPPR
jgi:hypothetical protein